MAPDDDWKDDDWKDEGPLDEDLDEYGNDTASTTAPCPECGAEIYEDAEWCPACGQYITTKQGSTWAGKSLWWVLLGAAGVIATISALSC